MSEERIVALVIGQEALISGLVQNEDSIQGTSFAI